MKRGVFVSAFSHLGPEILEIFPRVDMSEDQEKAIALKCIPMGGKEGDFITVHVGDSQIVSLLTVIPCYKATEDNRNTYASVGFLLDGDINPVPYKKLLEQIIDACKEHNLLDANTLKKIPHQLYKILEQTEVSLDLNEGITVELSLEAKKKDKDGLDLLNDALWRV